MTFDERVAALGFLGLPPAATRFVTTVALHGGYCLRRQYFRAAGIADGAGTRSVLDPLVDRGLATRVVYRRQYGFVYHLHARSIYRAIDLPEGGLSRHASPALVARTLMLLDFVLAEPRAVWCAARAEKVALFTSRFGVPLADLPCRIVGAGRPTDSGQTDAPRQYFADRWPIFMAGDAPAERVHFVTLVMESTGRAFGRFLADHTRLLATLPAWTVVAVTPAGHAGLAACRAIFERACGPSGGPMPGPARPLASRTPTDLAHYFRTRRAVETGALQAISTADLAAYREARQRLVGPEIERRYLGWRARRHDDDLAARPPDPFREAMRGRGEFQAHVLPYTYEQFGDFAGRC